MFGGARHFLDQRSKLRLRQLAEIARTAIEETLEALGQSLADYQAFRAARRALFQFSNLACELGVSLLSAGTLVRPQPLANIHLFPRSPARAAAPLTVPHSIEHRFSVLRLAKVFAVCVEAVCARVGRPARTSRRRYVAELDDLLTLLDRT